MMFLSESYKWCLSSVACWRVNKLQRQYQGCLIQNPRHSSRPVRRPGRLSILSLYTDEDLSVYWSTLDKMPKTWINAYDKKVVVKNQSLYDLKAIPTLYLLDKDKKVLLKDVPFEVLEQYLTKI
jgi:hypothetical protein